MSQDRGVECKSCGAALLVEDLGDNKKRYVCVECGLTEIKDQQGRQLLTEIRPSGPILLG